MMPNVKDSTNLRNTGIKIIGHMPWGSHLCQFYHTKIDLLEILLPYFKAGLKNNEFCMWITSEPLSAKEAKETLKKEIKNLDRLIKKGQIEILDYNQWYTKGGRFDADRVLAGWIEKERYALRKGFSGLRLTGNTLWLERKDWKNFTEYEAKVNSAIGRHRMLAICTYSLDKCGALEIIDVIANHQFALIKRGKKWEVIENAERKLKLKKAKEHLEIQIAKRTRELKQVNEALEITRDNLNRAQVVAHIGSWYLDIIKNILLWSDETYRMFGLSIGSPLTYEKFLEIVHPDDREYVDKRWMAALNKEPYDIEHRIIVDGKVKWVREKVELEFDEEDKATRGIGTVQDITERKQAEEDSRRLREELMHVARVTTMGELTAALAHELNQPLMAIMSNAQAAHRFLAKKNPDLDEIGEILSDIIKDDKRASEVIGKLRALLRKSDLEFTILNINDVIREVITLVHSDIVIKNISLSSDLNDKIPLVSGDRIQLQQVILNLILNSFEAMKDVDSKRLCMRTVQENGKFITVGVEDSGIGIDEKNIDSLFKPFFTTKKEGLGMGLSINKVIIEAHGGSLWAKNNSDKGATFYFTLPISKKHSK